ncbi:MAG TPA: heavy metal-binding domain-containing protein [Acidimicrobiales bacterium]|nr:heavy metal-binding domain-containing protein [Acidimicrobiales bacterium]
MSVPPEPPAGTEPSKEPERHMADVALDALRHAPGRSGGRDTTLKSGGPRAVSTDFSVDEAILVEGTGYEPLGLVTGAAIYRPPYWGRYGVSMRENRELADLSNSLHAARTIAMGRLRAEAAAAHADGVVGVRLEFEGAEGKGRDYRFNAIGTAIRATRRATVLANKRRSDGMAPEQGDVFTSDLSGRDFALLARAGYVPAGMVMGVCVYHVARRQFGEWLKTQNANVELELITTALYDSRELAMERMQLESHALGADGIVGVQIKEETNVWGSHVIEFLAIGTAVRLVADEHRSLAPEMVAPLDDLTVDTDPRKLHGH